MSPTIEPGQDGPRLRARAKAGTPDDLRPEVADALGGLERSIGGAGHGESGLPGPSAPSDLTVVAHVTPGEPDEPIDPALRLSIPRPVDPPQDLALGLPPGEVPPVDLDLSNLPDADSEPDPLKAWVATTASPTRFGPSPAEARRRRNGRIASWSGAVLIVGAAAFFLTQGHGSRPSLEPNASTTTEQATTTTEARSPLDGAVFPTVPTTVPAVPDTTPTTAPTTATTKKPAKKKVAATTTTTVRSTTTTAAPTTTTTIRVTTTTACIPVAPGDEPDPQNPRQCR